MKNKIKEIPSLIVLILIFVIEVLKTSEIVSESKGWHLQLIICVILFLFIAIISIIEKKKRN